MAGTFDPNQAQNLAEVRHSVPRFPRRWLRVSFVVGGSDRETVRIQDRFLSRRYCTGGPFF
jgi:hypothetical protein